MRAQCVICSDQFTDDDKIIVSALPCGHVFHGSCIEKWFQSVNNCPSCRTRVDQNKVIWKLYFDCDTDQDDNTDYGKLTNQIKELQVSLTQKEKSVNDIKSDNESLLKKLKGVEKEKKKCENSLREEKTAIDSLKKQLEYFQCNQRSIEKEKEECRKIKKKFIEYQNIERLLTGCENDMQEMLSSHKDGNEKDVDSLVKYVSMLKREYEKVKSEKKALKTEFDRYKRDNLTKDTELKDYKSQTKLLHNQLVRSEEDLKAAEHDKELLKKRIHILQKVIKSPAGDKSRENMCKTPVLGSSVTPDLFNDSAFTNKQVDIASPCSPELLGDDVPKTSQNKRRMEEDKQVKYLKISSASLQSQNPPKKAKREMEDISNFGIGNFNIFKKKSGVGDYSSSIRTGYNGLGCVETFTQPSSKPRLQVSKKTASRTNFNGKKVKMPSLPTLDGYINLD